MKKLLLFALISLLFVIKGNSQSLLFHEDFEQPSGADSVISTTTGTKLFTINTRLAASGTQSDSCQVETSATTYLITNSFSTAGLYFVKLEFDHICKISFFDAAEVFVSVDGGNSWIQLTQNEYQGSGNFANSKFTANSYPLWEPQYDTVVPQNTWWKHEIFDISAIAGNKSNVKIRFGLRDAGTPGPMGAAGWFIDNIRIYGAISELNPPIITMLNPIYTGTVYNLGPFNVKANVTDASGISSVELVYKINNGTPQTVPMTLIGGNTYSGNIPAVNDQDVVCYFVRATDASPAQNTAQAPSSGCYQFTASAGITFPYIDNFDVNNLWYAVPGTLWQLGTPNYGVTNSAHSSPYAWDILLSSQYPANGRDTLYSPIFNFSNAINARMSFWINYYTQTNYDGVTLQYTTNGTTWQNLGTVNDPLGVNWFNSTVNSNPAWSGNSNGWILCEYKLSALNNVSGPVQFRFVFYSNATTQYDGFSLDDFQIVLPDPWDIQTLNITRPNSGCNIGVSPIKIKVKNNGLNTITSFTAKYSVNNGPIISENVTQTILPDEIYEYQFNTPYNFEAPTGDVIYEIKAWAELAGDTLHTNDTTTIIVKSYYVPAAPIVTDVNIYYGQQATLNASCEPGYFIRWYEQQSGGNYFYTGNTYTTPPLYSSKAYYVSADGQTYFNKIIGTGTNTQSNLPASGLYDYSWGAMLYTASEIGASGNIDTLAFYVNNTISAYTMNNQKIYLAHVSYDSFADASKPDPLTMTEVFNGNITWTGPGWFYIKLQNPFNYNGNDNLLIYWENRDGSWSSGYPLFRYTATSTNRAKYKTQDNSFPTTSGTLTVNRPNIYISGGIFGCQSQRVPVQANVLPYPDEVNLLEIVSPNSGCVNTNQNVTIKIKNDGTNDINGNLTATYIVNNNTPVTENITTLIPAGSTYEYTFSTLFDPQLSGSNQSNVFNITAYVDLQGDIYHNNDTARKTITLKWKPEAPIVDDVTINYGTSATLVANSQYNVEWYNAPSSTIPIATGNTYTTPILYDTTDYWASANTTTYVSRTIGTGTSTQSYIPVYGTYNYGWSASLYDKTEIGSSMKIDTISWYVGSNTTNYLMNRIRVFLGHTSLSSFPNGNRPDTTSLVLVYSGDINWNGPGWFNLKLQNSFNYNGTDNLIVYCENWDGSWASGAPNFRYTVTTQPRAIYKYQDASFLYTAGTTTTNRPNIRFSGGFVGCKSDLTKATVYVTNIPLKDVGVISIETPNSGIELSSTETVTVKIKNYGINPVDTIPVSFTVNNGTPVTEFIYNTINPGDTFTYVFNQTADLSNTGTYIIKAYTSVVEDNIFINDTTTKQVTCSPLTYCTSSATNTADDDIGNVTLGTLNNGVATPVTNNPNANKKYSDFTNLPPTELFVGSTNTIKVSAIWSGSFYNCYVAGFIDYNRDGQFDTLTERILGAAITSAANNTVQNTFTVPNWAVKNKKLLMRIVLRENGTATNTLPCGTYSWGETEDYYVIIKERKNYDAAILSVVSPTSGCGLSSNEQVKVRLKNMGIQPITSCNISYKINNNTPVTETFTGNLLTDSTVIYTFSTPVDLSTTGIYNIKAYSSLPGDSSNTNDTVTVIIRSGWDFFYSDYIMGFEPNEDFSDWSVFDLNNDNSKWTPQTTGGYTQSGCFRYNYNYSNAANDVLVSRCFDLKSNQVYRIKFAYKTSTYPEKLKFGIANAADPYNFIVIKDFGSFTTTNYKIFDTTFTVSTDGVYHLGWYAYSDPNSYYIYIDDINLSIIPPQDAKMLSVLEPQPACNIGNANVKVKVYNNGSQPINGNLVVKYKVNNGTPVSELITATIQPAEEYVHTFSQPYDFSVTNNDQTFYITAWTELPNDPVFSNDTVNYTVKSFHIPAVPIVTNDTVNYGEQATLQANSTSNVYWYEDYNSPTHFYIGNTYTTAPLFDTVTYYVQSINGTPDIKITEITAYRSGTGQTSPYPSWVTGDDLVEIANLGAIPVNLEGYKFEVVGVGARTYTFPQVLLNPQEVLVLCIGTGTDLPQYKYYNTGGTNDAIFSSSQSGFILKSPTNEIVDAVAINGYNFSVSSGVTQNDWSGSTPSLSGLAGIVRVVSDNNNANDWVTSSVKQQSIGTLHQITNNNSSLACSSDKVPISAIVIIPQIEAGLTEIISPRSSCIRNQVQVSILIKNNGLSSINNGLTAYYQINNLSPISENITTPIASGDSLIFTFSSTFDPMLNSNNPDTVINIKVYIEHSSDTYKQNDTINKTITLQWIPDEPIVTHDTIQYGNNATLSASSPYPIYWYDSPTSNVSIYMGNTFVTPILYDTTSYWVEATTQTPNYKIIGFGSNTTNYIPFYGYYDYSWSAAIYEASELNGPMYIDTIAWYVNNTITSYSLNNQNIYLTHTSLSSFNDASWINPSNLTQVYSGTIVWNGPGWVKIKLNTPFYYNGTDNLLIYYENRHGNYTSTYPSFRSTNLSTNKAKYKYQDDNFPAVSGTLTMNRPNIYVSGRIPGCASSRKEVIAYVTDIPQIDAGVTEIISPNSGVELTSEPVKVVIKNYGQVPIDNFLVYYQINNDNPVSELITSQLAAGSTMTYQFTQLANLSNFATYEIKSWTEVTGDTYHNNDTATKTITNSPLTYCTSGATSTSYEDIGNVTLANLNNGNPTPASNNPTSINTYSDFTTSVSPVYLFRGETYTISLSQISASSNYASLFNVYIDYNRNGVFDLPDEKVVSLPTTSSQLTVTGQFTVPMTAVVNRPTRMRVVLDESDVAPPCGTYTWGETEDYTVIIMDRIPYDAGVTEVISPKNGCNLSSNEVVSVKIHNYGTTTINTCQVTYVIDGTAVTETFNGTLLKDSSTVFTFTTPANLSANGTHSLVVYTTLQGDTSNINDTLKVIIKNGWDFSVADYTMGFELNEDVSDWSYLDLNSDNRKWAIVTSGGNTGPYCIRYSYSSTQAANDIAASPCFNFQENTIYGISFAYKTYTSGTEQLKFGLLTDLNDPSTFILIKDFGTINNSTYQTFDTTFKVQNSGIYYLAWYAYSTPNQWYIYLDDINLRRVAVQNDASIDGIIIPSTNIAVAGTSQPIKVVVKNCGPNVLNYIPIKAYLNNNLIISDAFIGALQYGDTASYQLIGTFTVPEGNFTITVKTEYPGDINIVNDSKTKKMIGLTVQNIAYSDNFDSHQRWYASDTLWQLGSPNASVINAPYSSPYVWATNLNGNYYNNAMSYLYSPFFNFNNAPDNMILSFYHWYETQNTVDGGYIEYSTDEGNTWQLLGNINDPQAGGWYNYSGTKTMWTGSSGGWVHAFDTLSIFNNFDGKVVFRFAFYSNFAVNANGWAIDNFEIKYPIIPYDAEMISIINPSGSAPMNTAQQVSVKIRNSGSSPITTMNISYTINSSSPITETWNGTLLPGDTLTYNFTTQYTVPNMIHTICAYAKVQNDIYYWNDTICTNIIPSTPPYDAGICMIEIPGSQTVQGAFIKPKVWIKNYGTNNLTNIPVNYTINSGTPTTEIWTGNLAPGDSVSYTFTSSYISPSNVYNFCAYTSLSTDVISNNDNLCKTVIGVQGTKDIGVTEIILPDNNVNYNTSQTVKVKIKNFGTSTITSSTIYYKVGNNPPVSQVWSGTLPSGDSVVFTFNTQFNVTSAPNSSFSLCSWTALSGDINTSNDQTCKTITVKPLQWDAGISAIISPAGFSQANQPTQVKVRIKNYGTSTITSLGLRYTVNGVPTNETWNGSILPGDSTTYTFNQTFVSPPNGVIYTLCALTILSNDGYTANDQICVDINSTTGTPETEYTEMYLSQNIPNPANNYTLIEFYLPQSGNVEFEVKDVLGNCVYRLSEKYHSGKYNIILNTQDFAPGIYFYSMRFNDKLITRKMIIK